MSELNSATDILDADIDDAVVLPVREGAITGLLRMSLGQLKNWIFGQYFGDLTGQAGKTLEVNATEDGFDLVLPGGGGSLPSGTAFPGSPIDDELFYRTDLNIIFFYKASISRWLSTTLYEKAVSNDVSLAGAATVSQDPRAYSPNTWSNKHDIFVETISTFWFSTATSQWTASFLTYNGATPANDVVFGTVVMNVPTKAANQWNNDQTVIDTIVDMSVDGFGLRITENSGAASHYCTMGFLYRICG